MKFGVFGEISMEKCWDIRSMPLRGTGALFRSQTGSALHTANLKLIGFHGLTRRRVGFDNLS